MKNAIVALFKLPTEKFYQKNDDPYKLNDEVLVNFTVRFKGNINANRIDYACSLGQMAFSYLFVRCLTNLKADQNLFMH